MAACKVMSQTTETRKSKGFVLKPLEKGHGPERNYAGIQEWQGERLISMLFRTNIRLQAAFDRYFVPFAMTAQEAAVLIHCAEAREISAGKLAQAMGRDKGKISRFVGRLEARGLLTRKNNPHDHRLLIIRATNRGRRLAPRLRMLFDEVRRQFFKGILSEDLDRVASILSQLYENAERLC